MKTLLFSILMGVSPMIMASTDEWTPLEVPEADYTSIRFLDDDTGFALGHLGNNSILIKTVDGGNNWSVVFNFSAFRAVCMHITSNQHVYLGGYDSFTNAAFIRISTDGAQSWPQSGKIYIPEADTIMSIDADEYGNVVANSANGKLFQTRNFFASYHNKSPSDTLKIGKIKLVNPESIIITGGSDFKTQNVLMKWNGGGWEVLKEFESNQCVTGMYFEDGRDPFITLKSGAFPHLQNEILRSIDDGRIWEKAYTMATNEDVRGISFLTRREAIVWTPKGKIYGSSDGGINWEVQETPTLLVEANDICMLRRDFGFSAGDNGIISRLDRFTTIESAASKEEYRVYPNPASHQIFIKLPEQFSKERAAYRIINLQGQEVATGDVLLQKGSGALSLQAIPAGVYFLQISSAGLTERIIRS